MKLHLMSTTNSTVTDQCFINKLDYKRVHYSISLLLTSSVSHDTVTEGSHKKETK